MPICHNNWGLGSYLSGKSLSNNASVVALAQKPMRTYRVDNWTFQDRGDCCQALCTYRQS